MNSKALNITTWALVALAVAYGAFVTSFMFIGKPYTDEIYLAATIREQGGVIQAYNYWFSEMSSMPVKEFLTLVIVGMPSAYIDWKYANAITLLVPIIFFSWAIVYLFKSVLKIKLGIKTVAILSLMSVFAILISPTFSVENLKNYDFSEGNSLYYYWKFANISWMWSAATINYLFSMSIIILIFANFLNRPNMKHKYLYLTLAGLFIGFGNVNTAVIICAVLAFTFLFSKKLERLTRMTWKHVIFMASVISASVATTMFFPGNIARRGYSDYLVEGYKETFLSGMWQDVSMMLSPAFFTIPLTVGFLSYFVIQKINKSDVKKMSWYAPSFFFASGVIALTVNNTIAVFLYKSFWHQLNPEILLVVSGILFGYKIVEHLFSKNKSKSVTISVILVSTIILSLAANNVYKLGSYTIERSDKWWSQYSTHINCGDLSYFWGSHVYKTLAKYRDMPEFKEEAADPKTCDPSNMFTS